jgi:CrcB protein
MRVLWVAVAGAAGAVTRYGVGRAFSTRDFPWVTLTINLTGSFLLGLLLGVATEREWPELATLTVGTGFLGAYTTFSTFSHETVTLARTDRLGLAALYVAASVAGGLASATAGWATGRALA